eukprot:s702_g8.t1
MTDLEQGATTLVLRSNNKLTYDGVATMISKICQGPFFDYIYIPWPKLAVVNFISPQVCQAAHKIMTILAKIDPTGIRFVKQAAFQGQAENLSIFLAKSGYESLSHPGAPRVYSMGHPVSLQPLAVAMSETWGVKLVLQLEPHLPAEPIAGTQAAKHEGCPTNAAQQESSALLTGAAVGDRIFFF